MKIILICLIIFFAQTFAHMRLNDPVARSDSTGIKSYPCGSEGFWEDETLVTTLAPGVNTIELYETISHTGAPIRIAISYENDDHYDDLVLLDHVPHYDGGSTPKKYFVDVDIPDINCPRCSLQLVNPMTDKITDNTCCPYPEGEGACFSVYHSCANIVVTGTEDPETWASSYSYSGDRLFYTQESGDSSVWESHQDGWKYNPEGSGVTIATECPAYIEPGTDAESEATPTGDDDDNDDDDNSFRTPLLISFFLLAMAQ